MDANTIKKIIGEEEYKKIVRKIITGKYKYGYRDGRYVIIDRETDKTLITFRSREERDMFVQTIYI